MTFHNKKTKPQHELTHQMKIEVPVQNQAAMLKFLDEELAYNKQTMTMLQRELHKAHLPSRAPVLLDDDSRPVLTVHDVLIEIINISEAHKLPLEELAKSIAQIHPRIFENVEAAIREYPHDLGLLTYWLANRALVDVRKELDTISEGNSRVR